MVSETPASLLGRAVAVPQRYAPALLEAIPRAVGRAALGPLPPLHGVDVWNAYEVSYLRPSGMPVVAVAELQVPAGSPCIVESKSLKLYLNSLNAHRLADRAAATALLTRDLSAVVGAPVRVVLRDAAACRGRLAALPGRSLDHQDVACTATAVDAGLLALAAASTTVTDRVHSSLLRTLCPVTGQPDWACVAIAYRGRRIDDAALLRYLVSYRQHMGFHESCVEQIFCDVWRRCAPLALRVEARFTRRGGIDINPFRSSTPRPAPANRRLFRQ